MPTKLHKYIRPIVAFKDIYLLRYQCDRCYDHNDHLISTNRSTAVGLGSYKYVTNMNNNNKSISLLPRAHFGFIRATGWFLDHADWWRFNEFVWTGMQFNLQRNPGGLVSRRVEVSCSEALYSAGGLNHQVGSVCWMGLKVETWNKTPLYTLRSLNIKQRSLTGSDSHGFMS